MPKKPSKTDPHAAREASRYAKPIASREHILAFLQARASPQEFDEIAAVVDVAEPDDMEALRRRLGAMERDGQVVRNRRGAYGLAERMDLLRGRVIGHRDGFGFLVPDEGGEDVFLSPRQMRGLIHGDRALVRVVSIDSRGRREGALVEVIERGTRRIVGRLARERGIHFVDPDNSRITHDVFVPGDSLGGADEGQIVVVEIVEQPTKRAHAIGRVVEVLGDHMAPGMEIDIAIRSHDLPEGFTDAALDEASAYGIEVPSEALAGRLDLRDVPLVTIDGADARDFDDAVWCERRRGGGWRLLVAIADVSWYVRPGSALDAVARERGNSVYFPERVIPMLPEALSNGLCSLVPEKDRLCMVAEMWVDAEGAVTRTRFHEAVMRSHARLTYEEMAAIVVDRDPSARDHRQPLVAHLDQLLVLFHALRNAREARGAVDVDTVETRIVFGEGRKIERIEPVRRNDAHRLIEECMVAANVAAARHLARKRMPVLYRVHEGPTSERLAAFRAFLAELGLKLAGGAKPEPRHYAELIGSIRERPDGHLIRTVMLRSLAQAVYAPDNVGHFGLSVDCYAHFTSPIRRYADLLLHRALRHVLDGGRPATFVENHDTLIAAGEQVSRTERRADEATRDAVDWLKCEYMLERVGEEYEGTISAVTSFGLFVILDEVYVEGLAHISSLGQDYFHFDPVHHRLSGERTRRTYRLGDRLRVRVVRVNLDERKIDFELAMPAGRGKRRTGESSVEPETTSSDDSSPSGRSRRAGRRRRRRG